MTTAPWYLDWTFWTMAVAAIALILSQFPPLIQLIKRSRLEIDSYNTISITHTMGNPNATLYLSLHNIGGRGIKINSIEFQFTHADGDTFTIPAQAYFPSLESKNSVILPPFRIRAQEAWEHSVQFFKRFNRDDEKLYRLLVSNLKSDIVAKKSLQENKEIMIEAEQEHVNPIIDFYHARNKWKAGEYNLLITAHVVPTSASISKAFRFTLFETDANLLKSYIDQYKFGLGVFYFDSEQQPGIFVPLTPS